MSINIIVALPFEAKPIVNYYRLKPVSTRNFFRLYCDHDINLIVSGTGKTNSARAVEYLYELNGSVRNRAWLNIGIGGHGHLPLGQMISAYKIIDYENSKRWYPQVLIETQIPAEIVATVKAPEQEYELPYVFDMEASGFYETAVRFSTSELIGVFKIISDNKNAGTKKVTPTIVEHLVFSRLKEIDSMMKQYKSLQLELEMLCMDPPGFNELLEKYHFTVTEKHQLRKLLARWNVLSERAPLVLKKSSGLCASNVLKALESKINGVVLDFNSGQKIK